MGASADDKSKETPSSGSTADDQASERPPSYDKADQTLLQLPKLDLSSSSSDPLVSTVSRDQCVAHLKFLAVVADLRDYISNEDEFFWIFDSDANKFPDSLNQARARIREKRWAVYVARAVDRYTQWFFTCLPMSRAPVTLEDMESRDYESITNSDKGLLWNDNTLPPLGK